MVTCCQDRVMINVIYVYKIIQHTKLLIHSFANETATVKFSVKYVQGKIVSERCTIKKRKVKMNSISTRRTIPTSCTAKQPAGTTCLLGPTWTPGVKSPSRRDPATPPSSCSATITVRVRCSAVPLVPYIQPKIS